MQIFILDKCPKLCAQYHANKHVIKQVLETAQILCTAHRYWGNEYGYKPTHLNHPAIIWTRTDRNNYNWLKELGLELCKEYSFRYGKIHKSQSIIEKSFIPETSFNVKMTPFSLSIPDRYKCEDPVKSYRNYYISEKKHLLCYSKREVPFWLEGDVT